MLALSHLAIEGAMAKKQLLHLVVGGELSRLDRPEFRDLSAIEVVGFFPDYKSAHVAWRENAQKTVDNAAMRYFIVHLHRLIDPESVPEADEEDKVQGI
jgi:hypothetical protein